MSWAPGATIVNVRHTPRSRSSREIMADRQYRAYAAFEAKGRLKPLSFAPRPLEVHDVEIEITHCGVCHSDVHAIDDDWKIRRVHLLVCSHYGQLILLQSVPARSRT